MSQYKAAFSVLANIFHLAHCHFLLQTSTAKLFFTEKINGDSDDDNDYVKPNLWNTAHLYKLRANLHRFD